MMMTVHDIDDDHVVNWDPHQKMLESRPEDALVKLVKTVETVETIETLKTEMS